MSNVVGIGVVGAGAIAVRSVFDHFALPDEFNKAARIVAVCDPVTERAKAAAEKYGIPAWYSTIEELLADKNVDMISLCSPIGFHYKQAKMALEAGKHVHSNKTVTTTVAECDDLMALADKKGLRMVACPGVMLYPHSQRMRRAVLEGRIGDVCYALTGGTGAQIYHIKESYRHGDNMLTNSNPSWYFKMPGGGPMYDVIVYYLHNMIGVLGPAKRVSAFSGRLIDELDFRGEKIKNETEDCISINIDFGNNVFGICYTNPYGNWKGRLGDKTTFIIGSKGQLNGAMLNNDTLIYEGDKQPYLTMEHKVMPESHVYADVLQLVYMLRGSEPSIVDMHHARHVIDIIESGYKSAATGQIVELKPTQYKPLPLDRLAAIK